MSSTLLWPMSAHQDERASPPLTWHHLTTVSHIIQYVPNLHQFPCEQAERFLSSSCCKQSTVLGDQLVLCLL